MIKESDVMTIIQSCNNSLCITI